MGTEKDYYKPVKVWFIICFVASLVAIIGIGFTKVQNPPNSFLVMVDKNRVNVFEEDKSVLSHLLKDYRYWSKSHVAIYDRSVTYKNGENGLVKNVKEYRLQCRFKDKYLGKISVAIEYKIPNWVFLEALLDDKHGYNQEDFEIGLLWDFAQKVTESVAAKTNHDAEDFKELLYYEFFKDSPDAISVNVMGEKQNLEIIHVVINDLEIISEGNM